MLENAKLKEVLQKALDTVLEGPTRPLEGYLHHFENTARELAIQAEEPTGGCPNCHEPLTEIEKTGPGWCKKCLRQHLFAQGVEFLG